MNTLPHQKSIKAEQLTQLLRANDKTLISSTFLAILYAYMQRNVVAQDIIIIWLIAMLITNIARGAFGRHWAHNMQVDDVAISKRLNLFRLGILGSAFLWGLIGILMFYPSHIEQKMLTIYTLAGISAAAVVSYSVDRISALTFTLLTLVPLLIGMFLSKNEVLLAMSASGTLYVVFMLTSILSMHQNWMEKIKLEIDAVERENEIRKLAFFDPLTSLANRRLLIDRLDRALVMSARTGKRGAILFLDLDYLKKLNDTLGHDMGDLLLKQLAERLSSSVRQSDTIARIGGDEFVVMLENLGADYPAAVLQVELVGKQIFSNLNRPYMLNTQEYSVSVSIGVAIFGEHGKSYDELLKHADIAMYKAKEAGRNTMKIFSFEMRV